MGSQICCPGCGGGSQHGCALALTRCRVREDGCSSGRSNQATNKQERPHSQPIFSSSFVFFLTYVTMLQAHFGRGKKGEKSRKSSSHSTCERCFRIFVMYNHAVDSEGCVCPLRWLSADPGQRPHLGHRAQGPARCLACAEEVTRVRCALKGRARLKGTGGTEGTFSLLRKFNVPGSVLSLSLHSRLECWIFFLPWMVLDEMNKFVITFYNIASSFLPPPPPIFLTSPGRPPVPSVPVQLFPVSHILPWCPGEMGFC